MSTAYSTALDHQHVANNHNHVGTPLQSVAFTNGHPTQSMDGRQHDFQQSGLSSPRHNRQRQNNSSDQDSETFETDQPSTAQYSTPGPDSKFNPTASSNPEYSLSSSSTRQGHFPDYAHSQPQQTPQQQQQQHQRAQYPDGSQRYQQQSGQSGNPSSNMAQSTNPSIAASSPTYPGHHYSPYPGQHEMPQYATPPHMYPRPEHGPPYSAGHYGIPGYGHVPSSVSTPNSMVSAGTRPPGGGLPLSTVYSFVPIPGTHQQKRPRRRYEEIERMYKCGHQGCEKAYGTLNHLNAHVTMQSHGVKRTPEEFKEIRKEWKARKKEEENARKAEEDRHRQQTAQQPGNVDGQHNANDGSQPSQSGYPPGVRQLPPLGYAPAGGQVPQQYQQQGQGMEGMPQYQNGSMNSYYPASPYGQNNQMYSQPNPPSHAVKQESIVADRKTTDENGHSGYPHPN